MHFEVFGDEADPELLWVMGWGNRADSRHERWFVDRLVEAGYRVHTAEVPTNGTEFEGDYLRPLRTYRGTMGDHRLVSHSTGGLAVAHLQPRTPAVYLSPWWGTPGESSLVERLLFSLPTSLRFVPTPVETDVLGGLAEEEDVTAPSRLSPGWMRTMTDAQASLPPISDDDVVFYCPDDQVVSPAAIEAHASADQRHAYDGGHEFFACTDREAIVEDVLSAIEGAWD
jgi:hypothetical protein